jgi:hypothetical protein
MEGIIMVIKAENGGEIRVTGNGHNIEVEYKVPEWADQNDENACEAFFRYKGNDYFLSEFTRFDENGDFGKHGFHGGHGESYFSGVVIKLVDNGDYVKAYRYVS